MKAYLTGWSKMQVGVLGVGAALMVLGSGIAFAQSPTPAAPSTPPPAPAGMKSIMLSEQDIQIIVAMSEECVKAKGFLCAEAALNIKRKLEMPSAPPAPAAPK